MSAEHKQKISQAMKKHHQSLRKGTNTLKKGVADGHFGAQSAEYNMTMQGLRTLNKSMGPDQAYQLSIDIRSAINAIATNISKMEIRLFNKRSGREIVGGEAYDFFQRPAPRFTQSRWLGELASYYSLQNEVALLRDPGVGTPIYLMPLNPTKLYVHDPTIIRDLAQVNQWRYSWEDGMMAYYSADQICFDKMFNPMSNVRGLSPIVTGQNEIGSSYEAGRYNKQFFENGAVPSHMLVLPEGTPRQTRLDIENRYLATFGLGDGNAHKVMVTSGGDVKVQELSAKSKDAEFMNLISMNTQRIAQLFKVPATEMGVYEKTRYETADTEREMFYEGTLMPLANRLSDFLQDQVVDRWFANSKTKTAESRVSKNLQGALEKAAHGASSDIVVVVDPETTPIAAKIMRQKITATAELRKSAGLSFNEAAEYMGLELPEPLEEPKNFRDMVFIPSGESRIDNLLQENVQETPEPTEEISVQTEQTEENSGDDLEETPLEDDVEVDKALVKKINSFLRKYRKLAVKAADNKDMYRLKDVDALIDEELNGSKEMKNLARLDYAVLRDNVKDGVVNKVKEQFNNKNRAWTKAMALKLQKEEDSND